jgi:transcriptional regulator with XRE-family HTH domain
MPAGVNGDFAAEIGEAIRRAREERALSQRKLSELLGLSANSVSAWERGKSAPTAETLRALCETLRVPPQLLLAMNEVNPEDEAMERARLLEERLERVHKQARRTVPPLLDSLSGAQSEASALKESLFEGSR